MKASLSTVTMATKMLCVYISVMVPYKPIVAIIIVVAVYHDSLSSCLAICMSVCVCVCVCVCVYMIIKKIMGQST